MCCHDDVVGGVVGELLEDTLNIAEKCYILQLELDSLSGVIAESLTGVLPYLQKVLERDCGEIAYGRFERSGKWGCA